MKTRDWILTGMIITIVVIAGSVAVVFYKRHVQEQRQAKEAKELKERVDKNEAIAITRMRVMPAVQEQYRARYGTYATIAQLSAAMYIDPVFGSGKKSGYIFRTEKAGYNEWTCTAVPIRIKETGIRSFYVDQTGVIRYSKKGGAPTTASPPLD